MEGLSPDTNLSHYRIVSKIGAGGMGEVYLAQDTSELGRTVALKILAAEVAKDKDRLQRFTLEARTVSNLNHPNILTVHEFGQTDSASFIATEYVDGVTLREHLSSRRLKLIDVLDVAIQIVAALNAAHEAGVTHRDLKPENVMVRKDHIVKVLDFGLAKLSESRPLGTAKSETGEDAATKVLIRTEPGLIMGTVSYMSPEQSVGQGVDQRTDIWSFGVVLYEMIAGAVPFPGKDIHRQIIAIQEAEPLPLAQQVEGVPERLEEIVAKCLAKDKNERYQTAKDLLIDLRNLRRKLDVDAEIERTVAPALRSSSGGASASTQGVQMNARSASAAQMSTTSSAEYVVSGIKQHKIAAAIVLLALVVAAAGLGLYLHARNTEVAIESIAVLPFANQSQDPNTEYLSDGLTEGVINSLTQLPNLRVAPRNSVFRYKGKEIDPSAAGQELGVRAVLTGRVLQRGDSLIVSAELVDVRDNKQLWGEQYERTVSDMLTVKQEIAREITDKLRLRLTGDEQKQLVRRDTTNKDAYELYLKGRFYWNRRTAENLKKAVGLFQQAIDKDPNYAQAYVGLADCYLIMEEYTGTPASETLPKAKAAVQSALRIDDSLAEAHASQAMAYWLSWQFANSEAEFKRAIQLNPNYPTAHHWYSLLLRSLGRMDDGEAEVKRAYELDPLSPIINVNVADFANLRGDHEAALAQTKRVIDLYPSFPVGYLYLGWAYQRKGDYQNAIPALEKSVNLSGRWSFVVGPLGQCYALAGRRAEALAIQKELEERYAKHEALATSVAAVYAGLGDRDQAFAWLEKGFEAHSGEMVRINFDQPYEPLKSDPRFADLLKRMGLKP
jgi:serine/threonine protein kinase/tetratricopeptide (TPR) repeat protein